jgi:hypothetical protein
MIETVRAVTVTTTRVKKRARECVINGKERCGNDSEGDDKGGKGNGGRGYEDNGNDGRSFTAVLSRQPSSSCRPSSVVPPQPPTVTVIR